MLLNYFKRAHRRRTEHECVFGTAYRSKNLVFAFLQENYTTFIETGSRNQIIINNL